MELIDEQNCCMHGIVVCRGAMVDSYCYSPYAWDSRALPCLVFLNKKFSNPRKPPEFISASCEGMGGAGPSFRKKWEVYL